MNTVEQDGTHPASGAGCSGCNSSRFVLVTAAVLAALLFGAVPTLAAETIAEPGTGAGQVAYPRAVAVDQATGIVYLGEENGHRIDEFDPSKPAGEHFLLAFGWGVRNGASELQTCTTATGCETGLQGPGTGEVRPASLAVDASHDVYASDFGQYRVEKYTSAGAFVLMFGREVNKSAVAESATRSAEENVCPAPGHPGDTCGAGVPSTVPGGISTSRPPLTIDSSGNIWLGDQERLEEFSPEGNYLAEIPLPGAGEVSSVAVDTSSSSSHGDFYTLRPNIPGRNEVQRFNIPPSGSFELCFDGACTPPIEVVQGGNGPETREGQLRMALEGLPTIGPGNIREVIPEEGSETVEGVEFIGALARTDVSQLTASSGVTVRTEVQGRADTPGVLTKRTPTGEAIETVDSSGFPNGVAIDPLTGDLFVGDEFEPGLTENSSTATLLEFSPAGAEMEAFGTGSVLGSPEGSFLAFGDQAQRLYVASVAVQGFALLPPGPFIAIGSQQAKPVATTLATVHASVNPEGAATTYHFDYITDQQYAQDGNQFGAGTLETAESAPIAAGFANQQVSGTLSNLKPEISYHFRAVATNAKGVTLGERDEAGSEIAATFTTLPAALLDSLSASAVTAESATLDAEINPLGLATSYRFEYLTEAAFLRNEEAGEPPFTGAAQAPVEPVSIGSGEKDVPVSQHLQGLQPHTPYRYRVVAQNRCNPAAPTEICTVSSAADSFVTQSPAAGGLPDHRGWEMVSPPDKHGSLIGFMATGRAQAAASGGAMTFGSLSPLETEPLGYGGVPQSLAVRGASGWAAHQINTPHAGTVGATGGGTEFRFFSPDLSHSLLRPLGPFEPSLSAEASEATPYLRIGFPPEPASYHPLVTGCPAAGETCAPAVEAVADVPAGTVFGTHEGKACPRPGVPPLCGPDPIAVTPDLTHVVLSSEARLTADSASGLLDPALYEWSADAPSAQALRLVSVLPDGTVSGKGAVLPSSNEHIIHNVISTDGSRIVWESGNHLYLRYNATEAQSSMSGGECIEPQRACTLQLDSVREGSGKGLEHPVFQFASEDGSRIFFTDTQSLTPDSGAGDLAPDLYECQIVEVAGRTHCSLTDLTPRRAGGESAGVLGNVLGGAEDGSLLYFLANGALAPGAKPGDCGEEFSPAADSCNLYVVHDGSIRLVAVVSGADRPLGADANLFTQPTRVSPDGRWLAFMSQRSLTGYDNRDAVSGQRDAEVFLYHATADGAQIDMACPSCNPTGARPHGVPPGSLADGVDGAANPLSNTWLAASLPVWQVSGGSLAAYQSRYLSDAGRLFFNTTDSLTPGDTNGTGDVYQYEPSSSVEGAPPGDSCSPESPTYVSANAGCTDLISSGTSPVESGFLDASESGDEVFFVTSANLSPRDKDTAPDVYDARVGGGEPESHGPPACEGDACQSPVTSPEDPTPDSLTFQGPGNPTPPVLSSPRAKSAGQVRSERLATALKACAKLRSRSRHARCVRAAKTRYGAKTKAKRATNSRRAAR